MLVGIFGDDFLFPFWWVLLSWRVEYVTWGCAYDISWLSKLLHFFWLQCCCRYVSCHEGEHSRTSWISQISSIASAPKKHPLKNAFLLETEIFFGHPCHRAIGPHVYRPRFFVIEGIGQTVVPRSKYTAGLQAYICTIPTKSKFYRSQCQWNQPPFKRGVEMSNRLGVNVIFFVSSLS